MNSLCILWFNFWYEQTPDISAHREVDQFGDCEMQRPGRLMTSLKAANHLLACSFISGGCIVTNNSSTVVQRTAAHTTYSQHLPAQLTVSAVVHCPDIQCLRSLTKCGLL